ncbi:hypothetical protein PUMCH_001494 [Australozyma saopauloensis]|uniref:Ankyrin repeat-containing protein YAR1 n=1 Tax=Australozyma saopauloensis TaxID=291208 RepID=A0AAX4H6K9_9ASCO|nr:hypothetical protein PUMCH_001494 [[Candida] saopauloensis]
MAVTSLSQEEMDAVLYDCREGDLDFLKEVFTEMVPALLLPTIRDENTLSTPIHMAAANGHLEVLQYLLSLVDRDTAVELANAKNDSGNTPLHWACYRGHLKIVQLLVEEFGADVYAKNSSSHDALFEAEHNGQTEVENWLLLKFAVEEEVSVDESGENTKITYTPGNESYAVDKEMPKNINALRQTQGSVDDVEKKTESLTLE